MEEFGGGDNGGCRTRELILRADIRGKREMGFSLGKFSRGRKDTAVFVKSDRVIEGDGDPIAVVAEAITLTGELEKSRPINHDG